MVPLIPSSGCKENSSCHQIKLLAEVSIRAAAAAAAVVVVVVVVDVVAVVVVAAAAAVA